jgi:hypothetical protein
MPKKAQKKTAPKKTISQYPKSKVQALNDKLARAKLEGMNTTGIFTNRTDIPSLERRLNNFLNNK